VDYAIGIDLGGTRIKAVAGTPDGEVLDRVMRRTDDSAEAKWVADVRKIVADMERDRGEPARWIGAAGPGIAAPEGSGITWMIGRMEMLVGLDFRKALDRDHPVPVLNDAHAALLGEVWQGAAKGCDDAVLLTLGTGVGGAILTGGRLLRGHTGRAGHLGHISLNPDGPPSIANCPGSLEHYIGNYTIEQRSAGRFASTYELLESYRAGDAEARRIWLDSVKHLAAGIVSIINAVDPEIVVLAGGIAEADDALFDPLGEFMDRFEWRPHDAQRVRIVKATAGEFAGAMGAAWNAMASTDSPPPQAP